MGASAWAALEEQSTPLVGEVLRRWLLQWAAWWQPPALPATRAVAAPTAAGLPSSLAVEGWG